MARIDELVEAYKELEGWRDRSRRQVTIDLAGLETLLAKLAGLSNQRHNMYERVWAEYLASPWHQISQQTAGDSLGEILDFAETSVALDLARAVPREEAPGRASFGEWFRAHEVLILVECGLTVHQAVSALSGLARLEEAAKFAGTAQSVGAVFQFLSWSWFDRIQVRIAAALASDDAAAIREALGDARVQLAIDLVVEADGYMVGAVGQLSRLLAAVKAGLEEARLEV